MALTPTRLQSPYGFINYSLNTDREQWPSAPGTAFMHNGNGLNMIYVDPENDLVASCAGSTTTPSTAFSSG